MITHTISPLIEEDVHEEAALSACLALLLCGIAVALVLWMPQPGGRTATSTRDLGAGIVGLLTLAVMVWLPRTQRVQARMCLWGSPLLDTSGLSMNAAVKGTSRWAEWSTWSAYAGRPSLLLLGALSTMALTGGLASPLAVLLLLPSLTLDAVVGELGVPFLAASVWLAAVVTGLLMGSPHTPGGSIVAEITVPTGWAIVSALIFWLRVLLAARSIRGRSVQLTLEAYRREAADIHRTRGELLAHVSHELLTPLAAIQAGAGLLGSSVTSRNPASTMPGSQPRGVEAVAARRIARNVQRNTVRLTMLVEDMLELARMEEGRQSLHLARHTCEGALRNAIEGVAVLCESRGQRMGWAVTPADLTYWGDARRVDQVLVNLLANAHKYAGDGASIVLTAQASRGGVRWEIANDGPPLDDRAMPHLFDRYYRQPSLQHAGYGLGLSIAAAVVASHRGRVWAENAAGAGCRFVFWLPDPDLQNDPAYRDRDDGNGEAL